MNCFFMRATRNLNAIALQAFSQVIHLFACGVKLIDPFAVDNDIREHRLGRDNLNILSSK